MNDPNYDPTISQERFNGRFERVVGAGGSGVVIVAYKGPQRGEGGTVSTTARPGYTTHTFTAHGDDTFIA